MDKINILPIISGHINTLRDNSTGKRSVQDITLFFGLPLLLSSIVFYLRWTLSVEALNAVLASFAIFAGLLLNLLILVYTFSTDAVHPNALSKVRGTVIRELHDNLSYAVLVSTVIVVFALVAIARLKVPEGRTVVPHAGRYTSFFLSYLTVNFVLTLLMILKRIHKMLSNRLDQPQVRRASGY
jgi:hypothetical protein